MKFLHQVAKRVLELQTQYPSLRVVLPNNRAGLFLKQEISTFIHQPIFLPTVQTIEDLFFEISDLQKVEQTEQLFRLYESHKVISKEAYSFDRFLSWGPTFLSDCGEIDTNLIPTEEFFNTLYHDREIRNWNISKGLTDMQVNYLEFWKTAKALYNQFTTSLLNDGKAYNGLAYRYAVEHLPTHFSRLNCDYVLFVAFNALNRAEEALFDYVEEKNRGEFLWDIDEYYITDEENKAGQYFREYQERWAQDKGLQDLPNNIGFCTKEIEIVQSPNLVAQCDVAAQLVQDLAKEGKVNAKTAIILGDENLLEPLLYRLPKEIGKVNVTMGKAIHQFSMYHLFDYLLKLFSAAENQAEIGYSTSLLQPILLSPFFQKVCGYSACMKLQTYLVENNVSYLLASRFGELVGEGHFLTQFFYQEANVKTVLNRFHSLIEKLRGHYHEDRIQIQVLFEVKKIIQQFESLYKNYPIPTSISAFRSVFQQVCKSTAIPYEGEPLEGLQIMGVLETRALDFDNVLVLGCNEGTLPKGKTSTSFIPFIFKDHFQIQTFKDKDAIYAYSFYRLLHQAKRITFVYNGLEGALGGGEVSRFVKQLEAELNPRTGRNIPFVYRTALFRSSENEPEINYCIEKTEAVFTQIENYLERAFLSPSSLKTLVQSPLDFYFNKIAGVKEPNQMETNIETSTFGTIVHKVLENLYQPALNQPLTNEFLDSILEQVQPEVDKIYEKEYKQGDTKRGMNYLMKEASYELVKQAILTDKDRIQHSEIILQALEVDLISYIDVQANGKTYRVQLKGNADRIQLRDGVTEIIDYKTGKVEERLLRSSKIHLIHQQPDLEKLNQILCYTLMAHEGQLQVPLNQIRAGMQPLKSWQKQIVFINNDGNSIIQLDELNAYKEQLRLIIGQLLDKEQPFIAETDENRIRYSAYKGIYQ